MSRRIAALLAALGVILSMALLNPASASANNSSLQRFYNTCDSNSGMTVEFHTAADSSHPSGTWAYQGVNPCTWQGEVNGNKYWEPRRFLLGPGWCATWRYEVAGFAPGSLNTSCAGGANTWISFYLGDGYNKDYNVMASAWWRGY